MGGEAVRVECAGTVDGEVKVSIELVEGAYGEGNDAFYESVGEVGNESDGVVDQYG